MANQKAPTREEILRSTLFTLCDTEEHLHIWIKTFLGLDIPNVIVCDDDIRNPSSNSCPMSLIWEMYSKARAGDDNKYIEFLGFAARDSFKTLSAAVMETLCLFHLNRDVAHMAAIESQARNCQKYVENFLKRPILREFLTSKNKREIEITKYLSDDGQILSPIQWETLDELKKLDYQEEKNSIKIVICTVEAANGTHCPFVVVDECDLTDPAAFEEAKMIPSGTRDGKLAMTFYTSTRKYSFGLVQKEIDNAQKSNLAVRHWNVIDVTQACPSSRYLPDRPKQKLYYSESKLVTLSESDWLLLSEKEKEQYDMKEGHEGCLTNCKLFAQCKGRLIDKQTSKSTLLKSIDHVQSLFGKVSLESAKAQLMCWKPSSEGLIFPNFSRENHMISANKMAEKITGEKYPDNFSKSQLIDLMKSLGASFYCGMDHGFTHHFAVVTGALIGHILYIIDVISVPRLELQQKIDLCKEKLKPFNPVIYPDNAYPSDNATFRRNGFRLVDFKKDVMAGIEAVRLRLAPGGDRTVSMFLLKDDPGCELLASKFLQYHWKVDAAGKLTDEPDKNDDDELDGCRYLCQNTPLNKTGVIVAPDIVRASNTLVNPNNQWMHNTIRDLTKDSNEESSVQGKEGGLLFTI